MLATYTNTQILNSKSYPAYVHRIVQTAVQNYRTLHGKDPKAIYLTHEEALALVRWAFHLIGRPIDIAIIDEASFEDIPIKINICNSTLFLE